MTKSGFPDPSPSSEFQDEHRASRDVPAGAPLEALFPGCRRHIDDPAWDTLTAELDASGDLPTLLARRSGALHLPPFLAELARLEAVRNAAAAAPAASNRPRARHALHPSVRLVQSPWRGLVPLLQTGADSGADGIEVEPGNEWILFWKSIPADRVQVCVAEEADLLALKIAAEGVSVAEAARQGGCSRGVVRGFLARASRRGILLAPTSRLQRPAGFTTEGTPADARCSATEFTLQWHLTQACDLRCKHCYDRSDRTALPLPTAHRILDDLEAFCEDRHVQPQVTLSGGNPLLYPDFQDLYRDVVTRGMPVGILGNPTSRERLEQLLAVGRPQFYQVSLEGLPDHNDAVRGPGHFESTTGFLQLLKELGVPSMVMLTLTRENLGQVLDLAEELRSNTGAFFFNRLAMVGEGANLALPAPGEFRAFLGSYLEAMDHNPVLGLKDNLFNILREERGAPLFGGCTGHGCGAAFNFVSLLPDGGVHACRKFPSPIGDLTRQGLAEIYDSPAARRYRTGCAQCSSCRLKPVCGGCLASAFSYRLDPLAHRDPFCFASSGTHAFPPRG